MNNKEKWEDEFVEVGADLEHNRWAGWQKYLHSLCEHKEDGTMVIPKDRVERWNRQIATNYYDLSGQEKEYDRIEARKYIPLVRSLLQKEREEARKEAIEQCAHVIKLYPTSYNNEVFSVPVGWIENLCQSLRYLQPTPPKENNERN